MTRDMLLKRLKELAELHDEEGSHYEADMQLLTFIGDPEVTTAYMAIKRWYS